MVLSTLYILIKGRPHGRILHIYRINQAEHLTPNYCDLFQDSGQISMRRGLVSSSSKFQSLERLHLHFPPIPHYRWIGVTSCWSKCMCLSVTHIVRQTCKHTVYFVSFVVNHKALHNECCLHPNKLNQIQKSMSLNPHR